MSTTQLLARAPGEGHTELEFVEPDPDMVQSQPSIEANAPGRPIRLGTEMLLRFAIAFRDENYTITNLDIVGSDFRVDPPVDGRDEVRDEALELLRACSLEAISEFFRKAARGYFVVAVEVRSKSGGGRVTIRRNGWITVHNSKSVHSVMVSLRETSRRVGIV